MKAADPERRFTYEAEWKVEHVLDNPGSRFTIHGTTLTVPVERRFGTIESVQTYVDRVLDLGQVRRAYPRAEMPITVRRRKGDRASHYQRWDHTIAVPVPERGLAGWAMRECNVLHEVAHHLVTDAGHHGAFREANVFLLNECISDEIGWLQMVRYAEAGLSVG